MHGSTMETPVFRGYWGKRVFDMAFASLLILLTLPFMLLAALISGARGPVFYHQKRVWQGERLFTIWKFRTLKVGTGRLHDLVTECDERVIWGGNFLRKTHIDELPQLFQVLRGTMSLVGPRPDTPEKAVRRITDNSRHRLLQQWKPGLVGPVCFMGKWEELQRLNPSFKGTEVELRFMQKESKITDLELLFFTMLNVIGFRFGQASFAQALLTT